MAYKRLLNLLNILKHAKHIKPSSYTEMAKVAHSFTQDVFLKQECQ